MAVAGAHRLVDLPSSWCFEHRFLTVALGRFARILRPRSESVISTLNFLSLPPSKDTWKAAHVFEGSANGALWTSCSSIRMRSVGCGVLDVGLGEGAVGRCVGGVDGRSEGSAATKTAAKTEKFAKWAI